MMDSDIETDGILYSVLIIGCNRGLGLELFRFLLGLKKPPRYLFATCRDLDACSALKADNVLWNSRKTKDPFQAIKKEGCTHIEQARQL